MKNKKKVMTRSSSNSYASTPANESAEHSKNIKKRLGIS